MKVIRTILVIIIVVCLVGIGAIVGSYVKQAHDYDELSSAVVVPSDLAVGDEVAIASLTVDWDKLQVINPDIVAWVYMPNTKIDYPVVLGQDNSEYLHKSFGGTEGSLMASGGTVFVDYQVASDLSNSNVIMYGHHMRDGSMFARVTDLLDQEELEANDTFYVMTPAMNYKVSTAACLRAKGTDEIMRVDFSDDADYHGYLEEMMGMSTSRIDGEDVSKAKKSFMLVTCEYSQSNGRAVLMGVVTAQARPKE